MKLKISPPMLAILGVIAGVIAAQWYLAEADQRAPKRICVEGFLVYKTPAGSDLVRGPDGHALKCEVK